MKHLMVQQDKGAFNIHILRFCEGKGIFYPPLHYQTQKERVLQEPHKEFAMLMLGTLKPWKVVSFLPYCNCMFANCSLRGRAMGEAGVKLRVVFVLVDGLGNVVILSCNNGDMRVSYNFFLLPGNEI